MKPSKISRRSFVNALPLTVLATPAGLSGALGRGAPDEALPPCMNPSAFSSNADRSGEAGVQEVDQHGFAGPFSPEEEAAVAASPLAREIAGLHGQGYSCSEMMLLAVLRVYGLPENHVGAAGVFGGGIARGDLCGLLTGGLMAIGLTADAWFQDRRAMRAASREASNTYWDWWTAVGDIHCPGPMESHPTTEMFVRMTQRTGLKVEEVIRGMRAKAG